MLIWERLKSIVQWSHAPVSPLIYIGINPDPAISDFARHAAYAVQDTGDVHGG